MKIYITRMIPDAGIKKLQEKGYEVDNYKFLLKNMKKHIFSMLSVVVFAFLLNSSIAYAAPSIDIVSPNGGEVLTVGKTHMITWNSINVDKVYLGWSLGEGSLNWIDTNIVTSKETGTYSYDWNVNVGNFSGDSRDVKISITGYETGIGSAIDKSDDFFTVKKPVEDVNVVSPNGGETWEAGLTKTIKWQGLKTTSKVQILLYKWSTKNDTISYPTSVIAQSTDNDGSFNWAIPPAMEEGQYYTRVVCTYDCGPVINSIDDSDSYFTIKKPAQVVSTSPDLFVSNLIINPISPTINQDVVISYTVTNVGGQASSNFTTGINFPQEMDLISVESSCASFPPGIAPNEECTFKNTVRYRKSGLYAMKASASFSSGGETNTSNNSATTNVNVFSATGEIAPVVNYFTIEDSTAYGGSKLIKWSIDNVSNTNLTIDPVSGVNIINAENNQSITSTMKFPATGLIFVKFTNFTALNKTTKIYLDPLNDIGFPLIDYRQIKTIDIPASSISPVIYGITPKDGFIGTTIKISGSNFSSDSIIGFETTGTFNYYAVTKVLAYPSGDGKTLSFQVPSTVQQISDALPGGTRTIKVDPGVYQISVSNKNGKSGIANFVVKDITKYSQTTNPQPTTYLPSVTSTPATISVPIKKLPRNMWKGMEGDDVKLLQEWLTKDLEIYPEAITSGYFGYLTQAAVQNFQCKYNIVCMGSSNSTGYGVVGPKTRTKLQEIFGGTTTTAGTTTATPPVPVSSLGKTAIEPAPTSLQEKINQILKQLQILQEQLKVMQEQ